MNHSSRHPYGHFDPTPKPDTSSLSFIKNRPTPDHPQNLVQLDEQYGAEIKRNRRLPTDVEASCTTQYIDDYDLARNTSTISKPFAFQQIHIEEIQKERKNSRRAQQSHQDSKISNETIRKYPHNVTNIEQRRSSPRGLDISQGAARAIPGRRVHGVPHRRASIRSVNAGKEILDHNGDHSLAPADWVEYDHRALHSGFYQNPLMKNDRNEYYLGAYPDTEDTSSLVDLATEPRSYWYDESVDWTGHDALENSGDTVPRQIERGIQNNSSSNKLPVKDGRADSNHSASSLESSQTRSDFANRKRKRTERSPENIAHSLLMAEEIGALPRNTGLLDGRADTGTNPLQVQSSLRASAPEFVPSTVMRPGTLEVGERFVRVPTDLSKPIGLSMVRDLQNHVAPILTSPASTTFPIPDRHIFFISELIPRSFDAAMRRAIIHILRTKAPFLPRFIKRTKGGVVIESHYPDVFDDLSSELSLQHSNDSHQSGPSGVDWPLNELSVELFEEITSYLTHGDLGSLRLVNREFEKNVSSSYFRNVVLEFSSEIWGKVIANSHNNHHINIKPDEKEIIRDGMRIFRGWGPHVRKFAMAFEVDDAQLARLPPKGKFEDIKTWWGRYKWPHGEYTRYNFCAGLEREADEVRCMTTAFSNLGEVNELAICIDSGLGWLNGPDRSDHDRIFGQKTTVFGLSQADLEERRRRSERRWSRLLRSLDVVDPAKNHEDAPPIFRHRHPHAFNSVPQQPRRPLVFDRVHLNKRYPNLDPVVTNLRNLPSGNDKSAFLNLPVRPNKLTIPQREWLLENQWAQVAFLTSYCLALIDNSTTFQHVHTLNISKLSSRLLQIIKRQDIWEALPNLKTLSIKVSADFREVDKKTSGLVEAVDVRCPSKAVEPFHDLLKDFIAKIKSIKTLTFGYIGGGEHQTGIFGRNRFILPAPLVDYKLNDIYQHDYEDVLAFPHVEHLTMLNCWVAAPILKTMVHNMCGANLRSLTLNSVSLSAHTGVVDADVPSPLADYQLGMTASRRYEPTPMHPLLGSFYAARKGELEPGLPGMYNDSWVFSADRIGSWPNVIDAITPGPTLDYARYAYQFFNEAPEIQDRGKLEKVDLNSCGYVRLTAQTGLDQESLPDVYSRLPRCLAERAIDLMPVMMHRNEDQLLGQIAPSLSGEEENILSCGQQMTIGWGTDETRGDNFEDGQPEGGSGRFSGRLESWDLMGELMDERNAPSISSARSTRSSQ